MLYLLDSIPMIKRRIKTFFFSYKKYKGNFKEIAKSIIRDCFNKEFFMVSNGHFKCFYARDFGIVVKPLINLGYKKEIKKTIKFALENYKKKGRITTTISKIFKKYFCYDFPTYSIDSIAFFLYSILISNYQLSNEDILFINKNIKFLEEELLENGLPRRNIHFSSIRDHIIREVSCYDISMLYFISDTLEKLNIKYKNIKRIKDKEFYKKIILKEYWNGNYFYDDINKRDYFSSDSNIFPFYVNAINDRNMFLKVFNVIMKKDLDKPFPLRYSDSKDSKKIRYRIFNFFAPNYEGTTIWSHLGFVFIDLCKRFKLREYKVYLKKYIDIVMKYRNLFEAYVDGKPYSSLLYFADESLIWIAYLYYLMR